MDIENTGRKTEILMRFRTYVPKDNVTATSTDGKMTVIQPRTFGKKIGQRKRKINERTTTIKKIKQENA